MSGNRRSAPAGAVMLDAMTAAGNVDVRDHERCYRAVSGRDARFDGWFFTAVHTTGIYCRPSCPARTPLARNVTFFTASPAAGPHFPLLPPRGRGPGRRLPRLPPLPARRRAGVTGVGRAGR